VCIHLCIGHGLSGLVPEQYVLLFKMAACSTTSTAVANAEFAELEFDRTSSDKDRAGAALTVQQQECRWNLQV